VIGDKCCNICVHELECKATLNKGKVDNTLCLECPCGGKNGCSGFIKICSNYKHKDD